MMRSVLRHAQFSFVQLVPLRLTHHQCRLKRHHRQTLANIYHGQPAQWKQYSAPSVNQQLLTSAGYVTQIAAGLYALLPLAIRSIDKISKIVEHELRLARAQKVELGILQPRALWEKTRWKTLGAEMFRLRDRHEHDYCIAPTAEEVVTTLVGNAALSHRQLPIRLFQNSKKFRDETNPRAGLLRTREFIMNDLYTFDATFEEAKSTYEEIVATYHRIFERMQLRYVKAMADSGAIGGTFSHEFHVLSDSGNDVIMVCNRCNFAANVEICKTRESEKSFEHATLTAFDPNDMHILRSDSSKIRTNKKILSCLKALRPAVINSNADLRWSIVSLERAGKQLTALCWTSVDRKLNPITVKKLLEADSVDMPDTESSFILLELIHARLSEPLATASDCFVVVESSLVHDCAVSLASSIGTVSVLNASIQMTKAGDRCPACDDGILREERGIECGHSFLLGDKYSKVLNATFLNPDTSRTLFEMGCFGIGVTRILAAAIEQNHDERGIKLPPLIAPYTLLIVPMVDAEGVAQLKEMYATSSKVPGAVDANHLFNSDDDNIPSSIIAARQIYDAAQQHPLLIDEVIIEDDIFRNWGRRMKTADLLGLPFIAVLGKSFAASGLVELQIRATGERVSLPIDAVIQYVANYLR